MKYSKKMIAVAGAAGIIGAAGAGTTVLAATSGDSTGNYPSIVQKIASKFGLDPAKINDVFKENRQEHMQQRQELLKDKLDQAVKDGKLTQDHEDKLIAKLKSLHRQNIQDKFQDRKDMHDELEQWAKANGINNLDDILPAPPHGMGVRHFHPDAPTNN